YGNVQKGENGGGDDKRITDGRASHTTEGNFRVMSANPPESAGHSHRQQVDPKRNYGQQPIIIFLKEQCGECKREYTPPTIASRPCPRPKISIEAKCSQPRSKSFQHDISSDQPESRACKRERDRNRTCDVSGESICKHLARDQKRYHNCAHPSDEARHDREPDIY